MKSTRQLTLQGRSRRNWLTGWLERSKSIPEKEISAIVSSKVARPPQALPEELFNVLCNGCGDCVRCCPYGLLTIEHDNVVLNIDFTECDACMKCTSACQTGALREQMPSDTLLRPHVSSSCLGRQDSCHMCIINCPQQALTFHLSDSGIRQLQCDDALCTGCGLCKLSCFHGHIALVASGEKILP